MKIRQASTNDLEHFVALFEECRAFYHKKPDFSAAKSFLQSRMENNESVIYVCELEDQTLAGFVQLYPYFSSTNLERLWPLNDLFVHTLHRRKWISVKLIERSQRLAKDTIAYALKLETGKDKDIGNKLYSKTGFKLYDDVNFYEWRNPS